MKDHSPVLARILELSVNYRKVCCPAHQLGIEVVSQQALLWMGGAHFGSGSQTNKVTCYLQAR